MCFDTHEAWSLSSIFIQIALRILVIVHKFTDKMFESNPSLFFLYCHASLKSFILHKLVDILANKDSLFQLGLRQTCKLFAQEFETIVIFWIALTNCFITPIFMCRGINLCFDWLSRPIKRGSFGQSLSSIWEKGWGESHWSLELLDVPSLKTIIRNKIEEVLNLGSLSCGTCDIRWKTEFSLKEWYIIINPRIFVCYNASSIT